MYSNKENVNILTALLTAHGVSRAVVCPGSRNAPLVHNLNESGRFVCTAVTDERSAGFYALGLAQATDSPVVVCVTSGSALLNLAPAVAEACYQHQSLIVVSADRPEAWIDQMDGQTLRQPGALGRWTSCSVTLPEPRDAVERWHCNRLVNEALLEAWLPHRPCVHINVPISEPLFAFTVPELPCERTIRRYSPPADSGCLPVDFVDDVASARRPLIVFGQCSRHDMGPGMASHLLSHVIALHESLSPFPAVCHADEVLHACDMPLPDVIVHVGGAVVSKSVKAFLRRATGARTWRISATGAVEDTFMNMHGLIVGDAESVLCALSDKLKNRRMMGMDYRRLWLHRLTAARDHAMSHAPAHSQMAAVRELERQAASAGLLSAEFHYANSSAIRLANIYARHHVWCNRGVNGIEGSLSTAAGFSLATDGKVVCVTGDLSFFYDQNALWNSGLRGNLRIMLLNNGRGGIFDHLAGLEQSDARLTLVAGAHHTTAEGICRQTGVDYRSAADIESLRAGVGWLLGGDDGRPMLLEVSTDASADARELRAYYDSLDVPL